jgi:hypothetical protein
MWRHCHEHRILPALVWIDAATASGGESAWRLMTGTVILGAPLAFAFALLVDRTPAAVNGGISVVSKQHLIPRSAIRLHSPPVLSAPASSGHRERLTPSPFGRGCQRNG